MEERYETLFLSSFARRRYYRGDDLLVSSHVGKMGCNRSSSHPVYFQSVLSEVLLQWQEVEFNKQKLYTLLSRFFIFLS